MNSGIKNPTSNFRLAAMTTAFAMMVTTSSRSVYGFVDPAYAYCATHDGEVMTRQYSDPHNKDGDNDYAADDMYNVCVFKDGSECGLYALMNNYCKPGNHHSTANPASEYCFQNGGILQKIFHDDNNNKVDGKKEHYTNYCLWDCESCEVSAYLQGDCELMKQPSVSDSSNRIEDMFNSTSTNHASIHCQRQGGLFNTITDPHGKM